MSINEKLLAIIKDLKVSKENENKFGGYKYRSCEDILEAVKPLLIEQNLLLNISDEVVLLGERYYIKATAKIFDENGSIESTGWARESLSKKGMDDSQITGASSSYARKYALNGLLCIDDTKDADSFNNNEDNPKPKETPKKENKKEDIPKKETPKKEDIPLVNDKQVAEIMQGCGKHSIDVGVILTMYRVDNLSKLNIKQYQVLMRRFKEKEAENEQSNINGQAN